MKTKFFPVHPATALGLMLGLVLVPASTAAARNLVKNPSFEEPLGPDNWSVVYDNCDSWDFLVAGRTTMANKDAVPGTWDAEPPGSTNYLSKLGGHFAPNYCNGLMHGYFRQVITNLTPGRQYLCSAWMVQYTRNDNYIDRSQVWMEALGGPNRTVSQATQYVTNNANNNPAGWKRYAVTNTASAKGELELRLHYAFVRTIAQIWEYRNVNAYYDDVDVQVLNNQPPVADASATVSPVIATNRIDAQVVLDGSRSSDPDHDPLRYSWYRADVPNAIATGMVAVVTLPVGANLLELAVDDGVATNRQAFTVEVVKLNHPPVADASATVPLLISPNWVNAQVILDGSRSSDPDGDPLHYLWYRAGASNALASGMVAVVRLPVGMNALVLAVDDGMATNRQAFTVEVITILEALERLRARVLAEAPKPQPLVATLSACIAAVQRGNLTPAINQLEAFQNKVRAQVARDNPALAQQFTQAAQAILDVMEPGKIPPPAQFTRLERLAQGKVRMKLAAEPAARHVIEASTNLVDWELIGVPSEPGNGVFEFTDPGAAGAPARFYRIRSLVPNGSAP